MTTKGKTRVTGTKEGPAGNPKGGSAPLWAACRTLMAGHEIEFFSRWDKVAAGFKEDDVHDLRVASRRLREGLALFSPCFPPAKRDRIDKQVKKVTRMLGDLRNTDEAYLFFSQLSPEETRHCGAEMAALLTALKGERKKAHRKLKRDLGRLDPAPLEKRILALGSRPNLFHNRDGLDPFSPIAAFAGDAVMERAQSVDELLPKALHPEESEAQHALRIAVKKLRYRLEIMKPILRSGYEELHAALKSYQDVLGKLHDMDVFHEMLQQRVPEGPGREELLGIVTRKRKELHKSFLAKQKDLPLDRIGRRIRDAL